MKRLLILFIPLVFFFGCDTEDESVIMYDCTSSGCMQSENGQYSTIEECENICDCSCGEVVSVDFYDGYPGITIIIGFNPDGTPIYDTDGEHSSYAITQIENYCSNLTSIMSTCAILDVGDMYCGPNQSVEYDIQCYFINDSSCFSSAGYDCTDICLLQVEVIDGDTISTVFDWVNDTINNTVVLSGIDCL